MPNVITRYFESSKKAHDVRYELLNRRGFRLADVHMYEDADGAAEALTTQNVHPDAAAAYAGKLGSGGAVVLIVAGHRPLMGRAIDDAEARRAVGFLPENHRFPDYLTARQAMDLYGRMSGLSDTAARSMRADELLARVRLTKAADRRIKTFSRGRRQRVGIAQALAIIPGTSRSGVTMTAARALGYKRVEAARFSFLLSIPAVAGAGVLIVPEIFEAGSELALRALIAGVLTFIAAFATMAFLMNFLKRASMLVFVLYRVAMGVALLYFF